MARSPPALAGKSHYLPNGHRVNKGDLRPYHATNTNGYDLNGKNQNDPPPPFPSIDEPYLGSNPPQDYYPDIPFLEDEYDSHPDRYNDAFRNDKPYDIPIGSPPTSHFGSPPSDIRSPRHKWPSALDAPLPPSYTGSVPNYATIGHVSGSVPDKFGLASPANSTISQNVAGPGVKESLIQPPTQNPKTTPLGASPAHAETSIGGRILYSEKYRQKSRPPMSSSLPVRDFDTRLGLDSDLPLLPSDLHDELLTTGDKMRGFSRPEQETSGSFKEGSDSLAIPRRSSNVVGSPPAASSPSRFHHIFKEQKEKSSNIGVVGSPLRESWLLGGDSTVSSRPGMQMSGISQALGQMNLDRTETGDSTGLRPNNIRGGYARQISSPGLTSTRIDEEGDPATFFPMDDESTRRGAVAWNDSQNSTSRKTTGEVSMPRGMPIKNGVKPIFGFHG
ncbi:hypothetical protein LTR64_001434 [Lithohypha guttulata]|uniref:Uncharacterized protein n=1 Tax=Lithohypha guttulata TaxID=1690604 RepID=A0AAN7Y496_9EURO|nr:hypothetical protein LTR51_003628 [Lithohypha guttulata]KAK5082133.1 hypothetical protein LTR05_007276 [Lithohypha guttulata]